MALPPKGHWCALHIVHCTQRTSHTCSFGTKRCIMFLCNNIAHRVVRQVISAHVHHSDVSGQSGFSSSVALWQCVCVCVLWQCGSVFVAVTRRLRLMVVTRSEHSGTCVSFCSRRPARVNFCVWRVPSMTFKDFHSNGIGEPTQPEPDHALFLNAVRSTGLSMFAAVNQYLTCPEDNCHDSWNTEVADGLANGFEEN